VTGKALLVILGVLALSACGSSGTTQPSSEPQAPPEITPAIETIDEPVPEAARELLSDEGDAGASAIQTLCVGDQVNCASNSDAAEHLNKMEAEFEEAVRPAKGSVPTAIALLRLPSRGAKARARFITWKNDSGKLCAETYEENGNDNANGGPSGPCDPGGRCTNLCLELSGSSGGDTVFDYLVSGLVASEADDLRITLDDGQVEDVALTGPVVPGFPKYRVLMLGLGGAQYRRLELRREGKVIAEENVPHAKIKMTP